MTIIWAKKIKWKRTLFSDDLTTKWDIKFSAYKHYRKKIRLLPRAPHLMLVASAWTCRESDLLVNMLDKTIDETLEGKDCWAFQLLDIIQEAIVSWCKTLKEVSEDNPQFSLFILDATLNVVYFVEEFSVRILSDNVECVTWCWESLFYKFHNRQSSLNDEEKFRNSIIQAAVFDDWCWIPVYETNGFDYYSYDEDWNILSEKHIEE